MKKNKLICGLVTFVSLFAISTTSVSANDKVDTQANVNLNAGTLSISDVSGNFSFKTDLNGEKIEEAAGPMDLTIVNATGKNNVWQLTAKRSEFQRTVGTSIEVLTGANLTLSNGSGSYNQAISGNAEVAAPTVTDTFEITTEDQAVATAVDQNTMGTFNIGWKNSRLTIPAASAYATNEVAPFDAIINWTLTSGPEEN